MKRITLPLLALVLLTSCGSYKYYQPTTNAALFHKPWEVHVTGEAATSGLSAKAAVSLPSNIGLIGMYKGGLIEYQASEAEIGVGYYTESDPRGLFALGGVGFGANREYTDEARTVLEYQGQFVRPFVQVNMGIDGGRILRVLRGDAIVSCKAQRFYYKGEFLDGSGDPIRSSYTILEPAFVYGLGTRGFRFNLNVGFPFRPNFEPLSSHPNARTFPATMGFGLRFIFGRQDRNNE